MGRARRAPVDSRYDVGLGVGHSLETATTSWKVGGSCFATVDTLGISGQELVSVRL